MARKDDYGLPDETLQLIAAAPSIFAGNKYLEPRYNINSRLPGSELIAALRASGIHNPGFTQYANTANADSASARTARRGLFAPSRLTMGRTTRTVTPPTAEPQTPVTRTPQVMGPLLIVPDPIDPVDPPSVNPVDPVPPVTPPPVDPVTPVDPDPVDPVEPDFIDPTELPPSVLNPLVIPEPPTKEKTGTVEITPVDPDEETPQDDGTTAGILDLINAGLLPVVPDVPDVPKKTGTVEITPVEPEPEPVAPQPEPSLRDEIVKAVETQPQTDPAPVVSTPEPVVPVPEPVVRTPEPEPTAQDILELINQINASMGSNSKGGGKAMFDDTAGILEF